MAPLSKSTAKPKKSKIQQKYIPARTHNQIGVDNVIQSQLIPNLLLAYTHFLSGYNKNISIGYHTETFQPVINITHNPISTISLTSLDWMHLLANVNVISKCFACKSSTYIKCDSIAISIIHSSHNDENIIIFQNLTNTSNCITLTELDWMQIIGLLDLYKSMYDWFTLYASNIMCYYEEYIKHCSNKPDCKLLTTDYFILEDKSKITFNQLRLFYEIPLICKDKLTLDIKLYKLYHK